MYNELVSIIRQHESAIGIHVGFPVAQIVKNLPARQETWIQPLGWDDPLEKEMATHSNILT